MKRVIRVVGEQNDDQLSKQHKYAFMDAHVSRSQEWKSVVSATDAPLGDATSVENPEDAEIVGVEEKMSSKSRRDDNLNPRKDDIFLGEENSDAMSSLQDSIEIKHGKSRQSSTMATYEKHASPHQVFINFRGKDVGFSFVSHLVSAFLRKGVDVFIDKYERKDEDFGEIFNKIEDSKIALVVFSSRYAESTWCLDELVKIKERVDEGKLQVIPILYKVEPSQVQQLNGDFGGKLWNLWKLHRDHHIIKWKEALESVVSPKAMTRFWLKENG